MAMRTTDDAASVRLYSLDPDSGATATLMYGSLAEALRMADRQPDTVREMLWLQTDNDIIALADLTGE